MEKRGNDTVNIALLKSQDFSLLFHHPVDGNQSTLGRNCNSRKVGSINYSLYNYSEERPLKDEPITPSPPSNI